MKSSMPKNKYHRFLIIINIFCIILIFFDYMFTISITSSKPSFYDLLIAPFSFLYYNFWIF